MMYAKNLIDSYTKILTKSHANHLNKLVNTSKLNILQPIILQQSNISKTPYLTSQSQIPAYNGIFMLSTQQSFTNKQFVGANNQERQKIQEKFRKAIQSYEFVEGQQSQALFKIMIQIFANQADISVGQMPLHTFAYNLINENKNSVDIHKYAQKTLSPYFRNILKANESLLKKVYKIVEQNFIRMQSQQQFIKIFNHSRKVSRRLIDKASLFGMKSKANTDFIDYIAPVIPQIKQSFSPNCRIVGKYFTHLRSSVYYIESIKEIKEGQQLSLQYREGLNNYDILMRYNQLPFQQTNQLKYIQNPNSEYIIVVDFLKSNPQVFAGDINNKMEALKQYNIKLKNVLKIGRKGQINKKDMIMLRILFSGDAENTSKDSEIHKTITKVVENIKNMHVDINKMKRDQRNKDKDRKDIVLESIKVIEKEQNQILEQYLTTHK